MSSRSGKQQFAPLAQLAEQVTLNHWVAGSIPARCTFKSLDSNPLCQAELQSPSEFPNLFDLELREPVALSFLYSDCNSLIGVVGELDVNRVTKVAGEQINLASFYLTLAGTIWLTSASKRGLPRRSSSIGSTLMSATLGSRSRYARSISSIARSLSSKAIYINAKL